jgi:hypothetical protein
MGTGFSSGIKPAIQGDCFTDCLFSTVAGVFFKEFLPELDFQVLFPKMEID